MSQVMAVLWTSDQGSFRSSEMYLYGPSVSFYLDLDIPEKS